MFLLLSIITSFLVSFFSSSTSSSFFFFYYFYFFFFFFSSSFFFFFLYLLTSSSSSITSIPLSLELLSLEPFSFSFFLVFFFLFFSVHNLFALGRVTRVTIGSFGCRRDPHHPEIYHFPREIRGKLEKIGLPFFFNPLFSLRPNPEFRDAQCTSNNVNLRSPRFTRFDYFFSRFFLDSTKENIGN